jgi:hypothetical protein
MNSSTRKPLFQHRLFQMVAILTANIRFPLAERYSENLPGREYANPALQKLGDGWSLSGIATLQSGLPFSIMDSAAGTLFGPATH